jgi:hypothetical protein
LLANWLIIQKVPCMYSRSLCEPKNVNSHVKVNFIFLVSWLKFGKKQVIAFIIQPSVLPPLPFSVSSQNKLNLVSPILSFPKFYFLSVSVNTEILFLVKLTKFNDLGYVGVSARHSNQFCVSVNTERLSSVKVI